VFWIKIGGLMGRKSILLITSTFLMLGIFSGIKNDLYAGRKDKDEEGCSFSVLVRKCLDCFARKPISEDENEEFLPNQEVSLNTPKVEKKTETKAIRTVDEMIKENEEEEKKWTKSPYPSVKYDPVTSGRNNFTNPIELKLRNGYRGN